MSLHFVRTHDGAEVDFLLCRDSKPWLLVEAKEGKPDLTSAVHRFSRELGVPAVVVTERPGFYRKWTVKDVPNLYAISWGKLGRMLP
jgi:hypothetical protein